MLYIFKIRLILIKIAVFLIMLPFFISFLAAPAEALLFTEDFNDGIANNLTPITGQWLVASGEYGVADSVGIHFSMSHSSFLGDQSVEIKTTLVEGYMSAGTIINYQSDGAYYQITFDSYAESIGALPPRSLAVYKVSPDPIQVGALATYSFGSPSYAHLLAGKFFPVEANRQYKLKVVRIGNMINVYVDDALELSVADIYNSYQSGKIGLYAHQTNARFDDLVVDYGATIKSASSLVFTPTPCSWSGSGVIPVWTFQEKNTDIELRPGDIIKLSSQANGVGSYVHDNDIYINGIYGGPAFTAFFGPLGAPAELAYAGIPPKDITSFIPYGTSNVNLALTDHGGYYANTAIYLSRFRENDKIRLNAFREGAQDASLNWSASSSPGSVDSYRIIDSFLNSPIATTTLESFSITALSPGRHGYYIQALNSEGLVIGSSNTALLNIDNSGSTLSGAFEESVTVSTTQNVSLAFSDITVDGTTTVIQATGNIPGPPSGFMFRGKVLDIHTTSDYTPPITIAIKYDEADVPGNETSLKLFHYEGNRWVDRTLNVDTVNNILYGRVTSFSLISMGGPSSPSTGVNTFVLLMLALTALGSGYVLRSAGSSKPLNTKGTLVVMLQSNY